MKRGYYREHRNRQNEHIKKESHPSLQMEQCVKNCITMLMPFSYMSQKKIVVGYALNAKKLRKSSHSTSTYNGNEINFAIQQQLLSDDSKQVSSTIFWQGGGLLDILQNSAISEGEKTEIEFIQWNPLVQPSKQPHFDVLIHKLTEDIGAGDASEENEQSNSKIFALLTYLKLNSSTVIVDPITSVKKVTSRARTCSTLSAIQAGVGIFRCPFNLPKFILLESSSTSQTSRKDASADVLTSLHNEGILFPVICKPVVACGTSNSHNMVVIVSSKDIALVESYRPCIVQQYFNHDAILYKVYVMDDEVMIYKRKSLPNLTKNLSQLRSVAFDSRLSYPTLTDFLLEAPSSALPAASSPLGSKLGPVLQDNCNRNSPNLIDLGARKESWKLRDEGELNDGKKEINLLPLSPSLKTSDLSEEYVAMFKQTAMAIKDEFGLSLFGFDVIIPNDELESGKANTSKSGNGTSTSSQNPTNGSSAFRVGNSKCRLNEDCELSGDSKSAPHLFEGDVSECRRKPMVIDVNYFPSYKEVSDFPTRLRRFLKKKAEGTAT